MTNLTKKIIETTTGVDALPLRVITGGIFFAHGAQKLFGWFGGYGLKGTANWMASIGLEPSVLLTVLAGSAEFFGGLLLILGLLVRPTALVLAVTMLVAIFSVHISNGFFISNNGYEFALALLVINIALFIRGAGSFSIDQILQQKLFTQTSKA